MSWYFKKVQSKWYGWWFPTNCSLYRIFTWCSLCMMRAKWQSFSRTHKPGGKKIQKCGSLFLMSFSFVYVYIKKQKTFSCQSHANVAKNDIKCIQRTAIIKFSSYSRIQHIVSRHIMTRSNFNGNSTDDNIHNCWKSENHTIGLKKNLTIPWMKG